jgi:hypothetical protein
MASTFDVGDEVRMSTVFTTTATGAALDPSTVSLTVMTPDRVETTYVYGTDSALVRTATGNYRLDLSITQAGVHRFRWTSTGTGQASEESWFEVRARRVS